MSNLQLALWHMKQAFDLYETERITAEYIKELRLNNEPLWADHFEYTTRKVAAREAEYQNRKSQEYFHHARKEQS